MDEYRLIWAAIGLCIAGVIFVLVRKDWVHSRHAFWWLFVAATIALVSLFPQGLEAVAQLLGVRYLPMVPLIVGLGLVIVKLLLMDIHSSKLERHLQRLAQQVAILEEEQQHARGAEYE